jgi:hypothetical protein
VKGLAGEFRVRLPLRDIPDNCNPDPRTFHVGYADRGLHGEVSSITSFGDQLPWGRCTLGGIGVLQQRQQLP